MKEIVSIMNKILKEYISNVIFEELNSLSLDNVLKLPQEQMIPALQSMFPKLGEGHGRVVFDIGGDKVLKVARTLSGHANGLEQNQKEIKLYKKLNSIGFVTKIYKTDPNNIWIIGEKIIPFIAGGVENIIPSESLGNAEKLLQQYSGLYGDELEHVFNLLNVYEPDQILHPEKYPDIQEEIEEETDFGSDWRSLGFVEKAFKAIKMGINPEEILTFSNLGINNNNEVVLIDYGF